MVETSCIPLQLIVTCHAFLSHNTRAQVVLILSPCISSVATSHPLTPSLACSCPRADR